MTSTRAPLLDLARIRPHLQIAAFKPVDVIVILALVAAVFGFQYASGAYQSDFTSDEDEPAHVVSSLMVRDYVAEGFPGNPLHFAKNYYVHYPKVAIGHWPPLFYTAEAGWMLVFGRTRQAMLAFTGLAGAALVIGIFVWLRRGCGTLAASLSAAVLVSTPFFRAGVYRVGPDILLAVLAFWAAIVYGAYLKRGERRYALLFGGIALCAVMVHGRGAMLLFLAPVAALLGPRRGTKAKWLALLILLCAITLFVPRLLGQADPSSIASVARNGWAFLWRMGDSMSWPVVLIATIGGVRIIRYRSKHAQWIAMVALVLSGWIFQALVNAPLVNRYLLTVAGALAVLFGFGLQFLFDAFARSTFESRAVKIGLTIVACCVIGTNGLVKMVKPDLGCHRLIQDIRGWNSPSEIYLVAGDPLHEGSLIAEVALAESPARHIVLRASKVLAASSWSGRDYRLRFATPEGVKSYLDRAHVGLIFAQEGSTPQHIRLLTEALQEHPEVWTQLAGPPLDLASDFRIFRRTAPMPAGKAEIRIDMRDKLRRYLEFDE